MRSRALAFAPLRGIRGSGAAHGRERFVALGLSNSIEKESDERESAESEGEENGAAMGDEHDVVRGLLDASERTDAEPSEKGEWGAESVSGEGDREGEREGDECVGEGCCCNSVCGSEKGACESDR